MISYLEGRLKVKSPTQIVLEVNGVGYLIRIPLSTYENLGQIGEKVLVFTHLHLRQDAIQLYGFFTEEERALFESLINISGIGPRLAQGILSGIGVGDFQRYVARGDVDSLVTIPRVGRKTAQRLVVELKEKFGGGEWKEKPPQERGGPEEEALLALLSLGYKREPARRAVEKVLTKAEGPLPVEELIREALRHV
jgi:Holliday junction DNA helicase RuvA